MKGEVFAYVGLPQNLKDLKDPCPQVLAMGDGENDLEMLQVPPSSLRLRA